MKEPKVIAFFLLLAIAVGVNGYLSEQYNTSIPSVFKKIFTVNLAKNFFAPITFKGPIVTPKTSSAPSNERNTTSKQPVNKEIDISGKPTAPAINASNLSADLTSSYGKGKIRISAINQYSSLDSPSTITLYTSLDQNEVLNVAGWRIKTKKEDSIIPPAVEVYYPDGFAPTQDVKLKNGDYVYVYSSPSPINRNFRVNKCMGYLETNYRFKPSLSTGCPSLYQSRADIINFSSRCQDYITSLSTCAEPLPNPPVPIEDTACREFLRNVNYAGCFQKHSKDSEFLSREWRIFLSRNILDPSHDRVQLINKAGGVVDEYIY